MIKKLLIKGLFLILSAFLLFPATKVFAISITPTTIETPQEKETQKMIEWNNALQIFSETAYLLLRPLVALAGLAMDNSLVYGSFLHLDAPLWKIRTIIKNLGNFLLGFLFLYGILVYALSPQRKEVFKGVGNPSALIKKTLLAGVLIQMSWFVMMVLVDISTVLTYTVGALPTTLLAQTNAEMDNKVMGLSVLADMGSAENLGIKEQNDALKRFVTLPSEDGKSFKYIAACKSHVVLNPNGQTGMVALFGRIYPDVGGKKMEPGYCFYRGDIYAYKEWTSDDTNEFKKQRTDLESRLQSSEISKTTFDKMHTDKMAMEIGEHEVQGEGACGYFGIVPTTPEKSEKNSKDKKYACIYDSYGYSLSTLTKNATARTGPFMALYGNMVSFSKIDASIAISQQFIILAINVIFLIVLIFPLVALVGVLFYRVFQLRLAIALSPVIVIKKVFPDFMGKLGEGLDFLDLGELIKLLLAPALIAFALSISLMFVSILKNTLRISQDQTLQQQLANTAIVSLTGLDCKQGADGLQECSLLGFIKIVFNPALIDFYWFLISLIGIAITWFLLFAAIKRTKIGQSFGKNLQDLGEKIFTTMPLIPVPGREAKVGLGAVMNAPAEITQGYKKVWDARAKGDMSILTAAFSDDQALKEAGEKELYKRESQGFFAGDIARFSSFNPSTYEQSKAKLLAYKAEAKAPGHYSMIQKAAESYITAIDAATSISSELKNKYKKEIKGIYDNSETEEPQKTDNKDQGKGENK